MISLVGILREGHPQLPLSQRNCAILKVGFHGLLRAFFYGPAYGIDQWVCSRSRLCGPWHQIAPLFAFRSRQQRPHIMITTASGRFSHRYDVRGQYGIVRSAAVQILSVRWHGEPECFNSCARDTPDFCKRRLFVAPGNGRMRNYF